MSTFSSSSEFRLLINLEDFFTDLRKQAYVYVDLNKICTVDDLKLKITKLFKIQSPINLLCNNSIVLDQEDVRVLREDDNVKVIAKNDILDDTSLEPMYGSSQRCCPSTSASEQAVYIHENGNTRNYDEEAAVQRTVQSEHGKNKRKLQNEYLQEMEVRDVVATEIEEVKPKKKKSKHKKYSLVEGIKYLMDNNDTENGESEIISQEDVSEIVVDDLNGSVDVQFDEVIEKKKRKRKRKHKKRKEQDVNLGHNTSTISWNNNLSFPPPSGKHTYINFDDAEYIENDSSNITQHGVIEDENMLIESNEVLDGISKKSENRKKRIKDQTRIKETDIELDSLYESLKGLPMVPVYEYQIPRTPKNSNIEKGERIEVQYMEPIERSTITNKLTGLNLADDKKSNENTIKGSITENEFLELLCGSEDDYMKAVEIVESFETLNDPSEHINDCIVFKILKLSADYNPEMSDIIYGRILDYDLTNKQIKFRIYYGMEELKQPVGKFSLDEKEMNEQHDIYDLNWCEIIDARIVSH